MRSRVAAILLVLPILLGQSSNGMSNSKGRAGKKSGGYTLTMAGDYKGKGTAAVTDTTVSVSANVTFPDGSAGSITFNNLTLVNDRFQGSTTVQGRSFKISGRVDLPSAKDDEQSAAQAVTGRVTATVLDGAGMVARVVAIQDPGSRGGNGNGNGNSGG